MARKITIDPITRLEGHGKIDIFLDDKGNVEKAYFQVPELRGFEKFAQGRPAEDMPQITSRICGVCPTAHHMASTRALDDLYKVTPPSAARKVRELVYQMFFMEDHALHFFYLAGPDFIVGPKAPKEKRNILGVLDKVGKDVGLKVIGICKELRDLMTLVAGKTIHPVFGLPGGISKPIASKDQHKLIEVARHAVEFGQFSLKVFDDLVLKNTEYVEYITSETYTHRTYYMGLVDDENRVSFYDGDLRVVGPKGQEFLRFSGEQYLNHLAEHVEPWNYVKFTYLKDIGWHGFADGPDSGVFAVAPLARLNAADGMATPLAQEAFERFFEVLGGKPVHHTLAMSWARLVELGPESFSKTASPSPHYAGLPELIALAGELDLQFPKGIKIFAIEAGNLRTIGGDPTLPVANALTQATNRIKAYLETWEMRDVMA